jgi:RNA polymerase sigma factor (TIGR02999 family)
MPEDIPGEVTRLLGEWGAGDREALNELMPLVYGELRRLAHHHMAHERPGHTLQATELVDEVYLKLRDARGATWQNRAQFFSVAAQMMRFILVDYARRHARAKRGGGDQRVTLDEVILVSEEKSGEMLALDEALQKLEQFDKRKCEIAVMRFFAGLTIEETAEALSISPETVMRDWRLTRAWLQNELEPVS